MNTRSSAQDMPCQICYLNYPNSVSAVRWCRAVRFCFSCVSVTGRFGILTLQWMTPLQCLLPFPTDCFDEKRSQAWRLWPWVGVNVLCCLCSDHIMWDMKCSADGPLLYLYVHIGIIFLLCSLSHFFTLWIIQIMYKAAGRRNKRAVVSAGDMRELTVCVGAHLCMFMHQLCYTSLNSETPLDQTMTKIFGPFPFCWANLKCDYSSLPLLLLVCVHITTSNVNSTPVQFVFGVKAIQSNTRK